MIPIIDSLKDFYKEEVLFTEVDIDDNPQLKVEYNIQGIPAYMIIKDAVVVDRKAGTKTAAELKEWISGFLGAVQPDLLPE
jgi:thioredoxin-like negative regulator of GroEL